MDVIEMTRKLGQAIQQDERYLAFAKCKAANESDPELNEMMQEIQLIQLKYQHESNSQNPDMKKMADIEAEFNRAYEKFASTEKMQAYDSARAEVDNMMNYIVQLLGMCVNGADPETCEPEPEHNCDGGCGDCCGDCGCH